MLRSVRAALFYERLTVEVADKVAILRAINHPARFTIASLDGQLKNLRAFEYGRAILIGERTSASPLAQVLRFIKSNICQTPISGFRWDCLGFGTFRVIVNRHHPLFLRLVPDNLGITALMFHHGVFREFGKCQSPVFAVGQALAAPGAGECGILCVFP